MDIVKELLKEREERIRIFKNYMEYAKVVKKIAQELLGDAKVYVFGSVVKGDYHPILSDIDVAVVTSCRDRRKRLELKAKVARLFGDIFEIHVLNENEWRFYKRFIDEFVEV